ncbi:MAG: hypothetical protein GY854_31085 [Deltaproteobacteria bacterium]|nr:hypothetical protein [Deltaproteobacteria bacterium]
MKEPPAPEEFERLADCVDAALKEVAKRLEVDLADKNKPTGNTDPMR